MEFKVNIICNTCRSSFEIIANDGEQPAGISTVEELRCPNCQSKMPDEDFNLLKTGVCSLSAIRNDNLFTSEKKFSMCVKEYNSLSSFTTGD